MSTPELNALRSAGVITESAIFDLQRSSHAPATAFTPKAPRSLAEAGISEHLVESLVLKFLQNRGTASGQEIATQARLPFRIVDEFLRQLKKEQLIVHRAAAATPRSGATMPDFHFELTQQGFERARRHREITTYFGATPVTHEEWVASVEGTILAHAATIAGGFAEGVR